MALSAKREAFVREYLVDLNGAAAYRRAGYSARTDHEAAVGGSRLLTNADIKAAVEAALAARAARTELTQDEVITGLRVETKYHGKDASAAARVKAWELLGRHAGMWPDTLEVKGRITYEVVEGVVHSRHDAKAALAAVAQANGVP